ncbi:hypothetical protein [Falsochrobactrum shanghaiense]|nr:hypothetical protein [Falsochrobactrum shanghaiense]
MTRKLIKITAGNPYFACSAKAGMDRTVIAPIPKITELTTMHNTAAI